MAQGGDGGGAHGLQRRLLAGPEPEGVGRLVDQHPEAVDAAERPAPGRPPASGVTAGWYTRSTTTWPAPSRSGSNGSGSGSPAVVTTTPMPSGVALTTRSASPTSSGRPTRADGPGQRDGPLGGLRRAVDDHDLRRARPAASARATARPAPPAPTTAQRRPSTSMPSSSRSASTRPGPSVLSPRRSAAAARDAVHRAEGLGVGRQLVEAVEHRRLVGHRDRQAVEAERPHAAEGQAGGALGHLEGEVGPVEPGGARRRR